MDIEFVRNIDPNFVFVSNMNLDIVLARNLSRSHTLTFAYLMNFDLANRSYKRVCDLTRELVFNPDIYRDTVDSELKRSLTKVSQQLPHNEEKESFKKWWLINGQNWTEQLRTVMIKHCNIGHYWQFNQTQKNLL